MRSIAAQQGRDESTFSWSKALPAGATVIVRNGNGPLTVRQSTSERVEVRATKTPSGRSSIRDVAFDLRESGDRVEICTLYGSQTSCRDNEQSGNVRVSVAYVILVPRSTRVRLTTGNGAISVERAGAEVMATTGNGKVTIGETDGPVDVTTGNGDVEIAGANGDVHVTTGNGRIRASTARGSVSATTGNGDIDVRIRSMPAASDMTFSSGSGAITVTLPADINCRVDASTGNGSLRSDFEIKVLGRLDPHHVRGDIGKGGPVVRLNTGSGEIELRKS